MVGGSSIVYIVSPNFPMFPWNYVDGLSPMKSKGVELIVHDSTISNLYDHKTYVDKSAA